MGQKITWKELFDLTNDAEIKSAIEQIMRLNKEYTNLAKNLTTQTQHIDKAYKNVSDETNKLTSNTAKLTKEQKQQTDQLVKQGKATDEAFKKAKNLATAKQNAISLEKQYGNSVDALNAKLKAQVLELNLLNTTTKKGAERARELGASTRKLRTEIKDVTDVTRKLNNAFDRTGKSYDALTRANNKLKAQLRALPDGFSKTSKRAAELRSQIAQNTTKLKQFDKALGDNFRNVGNYKNAIGGAKSSLKSFALQLAVTTLGLMALLQAAKQGFQGFVDFEFTMTSVKALSGATAEEFKKLESQALELGSTTSNTAGEVAQLQLELTKLGFTPEEINKSTEAINQLSIAFSSDLAETAKIVAGTINGFKLEAADAARVSDIFAKASATTALNIEKIGVAMANVAPASEAANISLETTVAIVGSLVDQSIDASSASTGLRNVLLELASANSKLGKELGMTVNNEEDLFVALKKLAKGGIDNAQAMIEAGTATGALGMVAELTGKRTAIALLSIVKNREEIEKQSAALKESTGFLEEYAKIMEGTTKIALDRMKSSAEGFAISLFTALRPAINFIIASLIALFGTLERLAKFVDENKVALGSLVLILAAYNVQAKLAVLSTKLLTIGQKASALATKLMSREFWKLTAAMLMNPIGLVVAGFVALGAALNYAAKNTKRYLAIQKESNELGEKAKETEDFLTEAKDFLSDATKNLSKLTVKEREEVEKLITAKINQAQILVNEMKLKNANLGLMAAEMSMMQRMSLALIGIFNEEAEAAIRNEQAGINARAAQKEGAEAIKKAELALLGLKGEFIDYHETIEELENEAAENRAARTKKEISDSHKLHIFRLELQAKRLREQMEKEDEFSTDFALMSTELSDTLVKIEEIKRDQLLAQDDLTASARQLIIEKSALEMIRIGKDVSKLVNDQMIKDLNKLNEVIDLMDVGDIGDEGAEVEAANEARRDQLFAAQHRRQVKAFKDLEELRANDMISEADYVKRLSSIQNEYEQNILKGLKEIFGSSVEIWELETMIYKRENSKKVKNAQTTWKEIGKFAKKSFDIGTQLAMQVTQREVEDSEFRIERRSAELDRDLELAGDNEVLKAELRKQAEIDINAFEIRRREALIKQAKIEKAVALVSIAINTAKAIMATAAQLGFPAATPFVIGAGVLGAVQLAAAAAQPIPEFYKGTDNAPGGLAHLAERGSEMSITPSGEIKYHDKPTIEHVEKGTQVLPHQKTQLIEQMLRQNNSVGTSERALEQMARVEHNLSKDLAKMVLEGNKEVVKAVKDMERFSFEGTARGIRAYAQSAKGRTELLNNRYG